MQREPQVAEEKKKTTTEEPTTTTTKKPTPVPIKRPETFVFCTVSAFTGPTEDLSSVPCDYLIYTHIFLSSGKFFSNDDPGSWERFKNKAMSYRKKIDYEGYPEKPNATVKLQHYGLSFAADPYYLGTLASELAKGSTTSEMKALFITNGMLTAGLATYERAAVSTDSNMGQIKNIMARINTMLDNVQDSNTTILKTVFLGVKLHGLKTSTQYDEKAVAEFKTLSNVNLLILLTHLIQAPDPSQCKIVPLSRYSGDATYSWEPPSMERALAAAEKLKDASFGIALSVTFTVFLYLPKGGLQDSTKYGDDCQLSYYGEFTDVCGAKYSDIETGGDDRLTTSAFYRQKNGGIFLAFETKNVTAEKVRKASEEARRNRKVPLLWAVYDVQRDVAGCSDRVKREYPEHQSFQRFAGLNEAVEESYATPKPPSGRRR
ncbi:uncharacterized protein LOC144109593 [Amblyomma americanum]